MPVLVRQATGNHGASVNPGIAAFTTIELRQESLEY